MRLAPPFVAGTLKTDFKKNLKPAHVFFQGKTPEIMLDEMKQRFQTLDHVTVLDPARRYEIKTGNGHYMFEHIRHPYGQGNGYEFRLISPKGSSVNSFFEDSSSYPWIYTRYQENPKYASVEIKDTTGYQIAHYLWNDLFVRLLKIKAPDPTYDL